MASSPQAVSPRPRRRRVDAMILGLFAILAVAYTEATWRDPFNRWIGADGDPKMYLWFVKWFQFALSHGRNPLISTYVNYPRGINLMWNTGNPALAGAAAPVTALFGPMVAYNMLVTSALALSGWAAYLAARRYTRSRLSALLGGLLFMSSPYILSQYQVHLSLSFVVFAPLLLLLVDDLLVRQVRPWPVNALLLGVLCAFQLLVAEEVLATGALVSALGTLFLLIFSRRVGPARVAYALRSFGGSLVVFLALTFYPLYMQFLGPERIQARGLFHPPNQFVTDLANLVLPTGVHALAPLSLVASERWTGNGFEWNGYVGVPLIMLLIVVGITLRERLLARVLLALVVTCTALSLGPSLHINGADTHVWLPWALMDHLPVMNNALPARLMLYTDLAAALLVAMFLDALLVMSGTTIRWAGAALAAAVAATWFPSLPAPFSETSIPAFFRSHATALAPGTVALVAPFSSQEYAAPMVWQAFADLRYRMPEGYFLAADRMGQPIVGPEPSRLRQLLVDIAEGRRSHLTPGERGAVLEDMRARKVTAVVIGPMPHRDEMTTLFRELLHTQPQEVGGVALWPDVRNAYP